MDQNFSYPDEFSNRLQLIWGTGFLSPGGGDEVREILSDQDLAGKSVLDIGCGVGGPALVIAGEFAAAKIIGVDIEPHLIEQARKNALAAGLQDKIEFKVVKPGELPFDQASFDVVFSKDAIVHMEDKLGVYREIHHLLRPGGRFIAGDWFASENANDLPEFRHYCETSHLSFIMQTSAEAYAALEEAGFSNIELIDRNAWYAGFARQQVDRIKGPLRDRLVEMCGADQYETILRVSRANAGAAACGGLRPGHLYASKPGGP